VLTLNKSDDLFNADLEEYLKFAKLLISQNCKRLIDFAPKRN